MLKITDLCATYRCSKRTVERWIRAGRIPPPIQLVPNGTRLWIKSEIDHIFTR